MRRVLVAACVAVAAWGWTGRQAKSADEIPMQVSPNVVSLGSASVWLTIHADIFFSQVDTSKDVTLYAEKLNGSTGAVPAAWCKADLRGYLVAKYRMTAWNDDGTAVKGVKEILEAPATTLWIEGETQNNGAFKTKPTKVKVNPVRR